MAKLLQARRPHQPSAKLVFWSLQSRDILPLVSGAACFRLLDSRSLFQGVGWLRPNNPVFRSAHLFRRTVSPFLLQFGVAPRRTRPEVTRLVRVRIPWHLHPAASFGTERAHSLQIVLCQDMNVTVTRAKFPVVTGPVLSKEEKWLQFHGSSRIGALLNC